MLKRLQIKPPRPWRAGLLVLMAGVVACNPNPTQRQIPASPAVSQTELTTGNRPQVLATTGVLCDLTKKIAQNTVETVCLVGPGQDPHTYQPAPEDRKAIETAQLILYGGYEHEPTLLKLIKASRNQAPKVAVHEQAVPKPLIGKEHEHGHGVEDAAHEDRGGEKVAGHNHDRESEQVPDPHVWHNAQNGIRMAKTIREHLIKIAPNQAELYTRNTQQLIGELEKLDAWIKVQIATIPPEKRKLVTTHDALSYYATAYGLEMAGALQGITTNEQPTPQRIADLTSAIQSTGVPTIFAEITVNPKLMEAVAREAKVKISAQELYSDGLGVPDSAGDSYEKMLRVNTCTIVDGLGGKCTPFESQPAGK